MPFAVGSSQPVARSIMNNASKTQADGHYFLAVVAVVWLVFVVNRISTLADFENCINLQELYLRKNNLTDIDELVYLQNLPKLKYLWLEENPLVEHAGPGYRQIVLRALPNLKKLDNVDVSPEEVAEAMRAPVAQPQQRHEVYENPSPPPPVQHQQTSPQQQQQQYRQQSPVIEQQMSPENTESECISDPADRASIPSSPLQRSPPNRDCYSPPSQAQNSHASSHYNTNNHRGSYQQYDVSEHMLVTTTPFALLPFKIATLW
uniref:U2A'/phosphoprotein 32 family A C-terminal domain-containing protein n=1 Tax=Anopheles melas TaxID=34690 RepID=A0A182UJ40_9DIPT